MYGKWFSVQESNDSFYKFCYTVHEMLHIFSAASNSICYTSQKG